MLVVDFVLANFSIDFFNQPSVEAVVCLRWVREPAYKYDENLRISIVDMESQ